MYLTWIESRPRTAPPLGSPTPDPPSRGKRQTASVFSLHDVSRPRRTGERGPAALADAMIDGGTAEGMVAGGACRDRTDDPLLAKQVLSQLS